MRLVSNDKYVAFINRNPVVCHDAKVIHRKQLGRIVVSAWEGAVESNLEVSVKERSLPPIYLKDVMKGGMRERFAELRKMGLLSEARGIPGLVGSWIRELKSL